MLAECRLRSGALKYLGAMAVLAAVAAGATATGSATGDDLVSEVQLSSISRISPSKLPANRRRVLVRIALSEQIRTPSGAHPPPLRELQIALDRHLSLSVKGLPSCPRQLGGRQSRQNPFERCEEAKVGSGIVKLDVAFPEVPPVQISGRLSAYNGGVRKGRPVLWLFAYFPAPVTGGILTPLEFRRSSPGLFGWTGRASFPKIANGAGSITYLSLRFRKGLFSAGCPIGKWISRGGATFINGEAAAVSSLQRCFLA